jgi:hypothetical protein
LAILASDVRDGQVASMTFQTGAGSAMNAS